MLRVGRASRWQAAICCSSSEQCFGDTFQFVRFASSVESRGRSRRVGRSAGSFAGSLASHPDLDQVCPLVGAAEFAGSRFFAAAAERSVRLEDESGDHSRRSSLPVCRPGSRRALAARAGPGQGIQDRHRLASVERPTGVIWSLGTAGEFCTAGRLARRAVDQLAKRTGIGADEDRRCFPVSIFPSGWTRRPARSWTRRP